MERDKVDVENVEVMSIVSMEKLNIIAKNVEEVVFVSMER